MPYGTIKVDNITFTDNSVDKTVSLSGLIQNPTFTGNVTVTGTISGDVIRGGTTISGVTVTGTTANFVSGVFTTQVSGATIIATTGTFTSLTGTTTTGTTANFVSGVFTTQVSGATITGTTVSTTTGSFVSLTGTTATFTSGIIASGTAALPSLAILSDPNTGLFSPGADQLAISTNGSGKLFINSAGDIGVGAAPSGSFKLEVKGGAIDSVALLDSTNAVGPHLRFSTSGTDRHFLGSAPGFTSGGTSSDFAIRTTGYLALLTGGNNERARIRADGLFEIKGAGTAGSSPAFSVNQSAPANSFFIDSGGKLGLGTSAPGYKLDVNGEVAFSPNTAGKKTFYFTTNASNDASLFLKSNTTDKVNIQANGTSYFNGGNVGIGTSNPSYSFHALTSDTTSAAFKNPGAATTQIIVGNTAGDTQFKTLSTGDGFIYADNGKYLAFGTNGGLERARIDSSGRLLVGTSTNTGANLLQVNSDALVNGLTVGRGASAISGNTAVGLNALQSNTTGDNNTANGRNALYSNTTGNYNTANGVNAFFSNTTGDNNAANGRNALYSNTTGSSNTANGFSALFSNTTGGNNTAIGLEAGYGDGTQANTTGANNTFIGFDAMGASSTANNVITLGNGAIATLRAQVTTITALSDERDKKNIVPLNAGLDFLTKLRPVSFTWNTRDKAKVDVEDTGFIAQELLAVQEDTGITIPNLVSQENPDKLEAGYGTLIPVLVSAVQELTAMVKQLQDEITTLKGDN